MSQTDTETRGARSSRAPIDPRLLRRARAMRGFLALGGLLGLIQTASIIGFAWFVSVLVTGAIAGQSLAELSGSFAALAAMVLLRAFTVWAMDAASAAGAARVKSQLRVAVLAGIRKLGPSWTQRRGSAATATLVGPGLDALDGYFGKYLPQLILTAIATPLLVLAIFLNDWLSALIVALALPIIPLFMVLIGMATQAVQRKQWDSLQHLSGSFLDVVGGLATLKIFGRERRQLARIRTVTDSYRTETMKVLRLSFLSGFVLELAGSLSVALIAVTIGLRLLDGQLTLAVGLFVLILAPEVFLPVRNVGAQFHAAADGMAASAEVFEVLELADAIPADAAAAAAAPAQARGPLRLDGVSVHRGDRLIVDGLSAEFEPGTLSVLAGQSGSGKSTVLAALLGFVPSAGEITLGDGPLTRTEIAWAGQNPALGSGSVAGNIALGSALAEGTPERVRLIEASMRLAAASGIDPEHELGVNGAGLSGGQAQRVALARAFYRWQELGTPVLLLDEPSSALDAETEARLLGSLRAAADAGAIVIVVSHREAVLAAADRVLWLETVHVD
ncbi:thiol reductant ABC exporter subunit CydD [Microterricola pindariensis]|uniref:Thiol reductant ABC exporter subunit CydD n=1 Tax=Microterricola pindariensis TaxID=478010 RepID=A0ABX5AS71_9MICO|nr:thiol reductant ABC exporter subunit CydD [Microterricola pindariensis]PPL15086.1 thiol reductant ABC exporter subunit CydD [Microterricola pindariensis]